MRLDVIWDFDLTNQLIVLLCEINNERHYLLGRYTPLLTDLTGVTISSAKEFHKKSRSLFHTTISGTSNSIQVTQKHRLSGHTDGVGRRLPGQ